MLKRLIPGIIMVLILLAGVAAQAENNALTGEELNALADQIRSLADQETVLNDPSSEEAVSEDGYAFQYDFGVVYADQPVLTEETKVNAFLLMDREAGVTVPRGISIDWTVNQLMAAIPCDNGDMNGTYESALLYLEGSPENGYLYGLVQRDGQRISAMEYGCADPAAERKISLTFGISGDGVNFIRMDGMNEPFSGEAAAELYTEMEALAQTYYYARVPRSLDGTELEPFHEGDLDFSALSYRTAQPNIFGDNVEDMLIDNEDGTWLRRIDGDGFEAVFVTDAAGEDARLISYSILSPDLEGPRCVRLGDLFHEDYTRFRSGEGELDEDGKTETLYGKVGEPSYGLAEYGDGTEMALRYVTQTLSGRKVELLLRYQDTVLTEIILHTLEEDE